MMRGVRRVLAGVALAWVFALAAVVPAAAETTSPSPVATASAAATGTASATEAPEVAPDNSAPIWALGGAAVVAVIAGALVFLRRS